MTQPAAAPAAPATPAAVPSGGATPATTAKPADAKIAQAPPKEATSESAEKIRVRGYERAAKVKAKLDSSSPSESAVEDKTSSPAPTSAADSGGDKPEKPQPAAGHDVDLRAKHAEDRAKRIAEVARKEREAEAERAAKRQSKATDQEVEKLRKRVAELEPMNDVFANEEALLAEAERRNMSAEKLVTWMRKRLSDPAAVAERQVKTETDKLREELRTAMERVEKAERAREQEWEAMRAERESIERASSFTRQVSAATESHPLTASLLKRRGANGFVEFANAQVMPYIPEGSSLEYIHDVMEQYLDWITGGESPEPDSSASGREPPPKKNGAAKPVTTLSNALAAERISVTEETPLHHLPLSERKRRLREKLERE